jgi:hypothetical protein
MNKNITLLAALLLTACGTATRCPDPFGCSSGNSVKAAPAPSKPAGNATPASKPSEGNGGGSNPGIGKPSDGAKPGKPGPSGPPGKGDGKPGKGDGKGHGDGKK